MTDNEKTVIEAAKKVMARWHGLPWTTTDAAPDAATCLPTMVWRDFLCGEVRDLDDALVALTAGTEPEKPCGYCACGHASADHFFDKPHACNFGHPCRCAGFKEAE